MSCEDKKGFVTQNNRADKAMGPVFVGVLPEQEAKRCLVRVLQGDIKGAEAHLVGEADFKGLFLIDSVKNRFDNAYLISVPILDPSTVFERSSMSPKVLSLVTQIPG